MPSHLSQNTCSNMYGMHWIYLLYFSAAIFTVCCNQDDTAISLEQLIDAVSKESSSIVVYDASYEYSPLVLQMVDFSYPFLKYEYQPFCTFIKHHMKNVMENGILKELYRQLNFILICGKKKTVNLVKMVTELDNTIGQGSLLRHFSKWLIISHDSPPYLNITLDNVAIVRVSQVNSREETHLPIHSGYLKTPWTLLVAEVHTLLWKPGRRDWSRVHQSDDLLSSLFSNLKRGLNGRELRLATLEWTIMTIRTNSTGDVTYKGAGIDAVDILARKFNFSYFVVEPEDMLWGQIQENGSCTGVLGMLQRAEADLCPAPYAINQRRLQIIDITSPLEGAEWKLLHRRQKVHTDSWWYLLPWFSWQVYMCALASLLWMVILFVSITNQDRMSSSRKRNFSSCFEVGIRIPLQQAISTFPEFTPERIIFWTWSIFCLVMAVVYTGSVVAFATVEKYSLPFTTLQELASLDEYTVGVTEGDYAESILMHSENPTLRLISQKVLKSTTDSKSLATDITPRLLNEKYVLICPATMSRMIRSSTCDVVELKEAFATVYSGFAFPPNSPLKKLFDEQVMLLGELGVFTKISNKWSPKALDCGTSMAAPQVKLTSMKTLLVICIAGVVVATVFLLVERGKNNNCCAVERRTPRRAHLQTKL